MSRKETLCQTLQTQESTTMNAAFKKTVIVEEDEKTDKEVIEYCRKVYERETKRENTNHLRRFFPPAKIKKYRYWGQGSLGRYSKRDYQQKIMKKAA